jgi:hypothetical protein
MQIEQINLQYNRLEDRMVVRLGVSEDKELRFFLTRLLALELLKVLGAGRDDAASRFAACIGAPSLDPETAREFADQKAMAGLSTDRPYRAQGRQPLLGERIPLIAHVDWRYRGEQLTLAFRTDAGERFTLDLGPALVAGFAGLLDKLAGSVGWLTDAPAAAAGLPAGASVH